MAAITAVLFLVSLLASIATLHGSGPRTESPASNYLRITCEPSIPIYGGQVKLHCEWVDWPDEELEDYHLNWYFNYEEIEDKYSESSSDSHKPPKYTLADTRTGSSLTIRNITQLDAGRYRCETKNHQYNKGIEIQPKYPEMEMFFDKNASSPMRQGATAIIWCHVVGNPNAQHEINIIYDGVEAETRKSQIHWGYLQPVMGGTSDVPAHEYGELGYQANTHTTSNSSSVSLKIKLIDVEIQQSGSYYCSGDRLSEDQPELYKTVELGVHGIRIKCVSKEADEVKVGDDKTFSCEIYSNPKIDNGNAIVWQKDGNQIKPAVRDSKYDIGINGVGQHRINTVLTIKDVQPKDEAVYAVKVTLRTTLGIFTETKNMTISVPACSCTPPMVCVGKQCLCPQGYRPNPNKFPPCIDLGGSNKPQDENNKFGQQDGKVSVTHSSVAGVVGGAMGALAVIVIIIIAFVCYRRRKSSTRKEDIEPPYNPYYQYHGEATVIRDLPSFDNLGYEMQPVKLPATKENTYTSMSRARLEFPREHLQLGVDLGEGRFGKVIQARAMNILGDGKWLAVAVKTCRPSATDSEKQDLYQELEIMRKIPRHANMVCLLGCCTRADPLYIIMEYVQRGSMLSYLRKCRPSSIMSMESRSSSFMQPRAKDLTIFALQVARGMAHLASFGIIHRDLAARNVLLDTDFTCKICDFGLARDVEGVDVYERTSKGPLPIRWMAPEALEENCYTRKSDVWSYGVLLWEIVTLGATPYTGMSAMEVLRQVLNGLRLQRPLHCKEEMYELMVRCWTKVPDSRPSFSDIVTHHEALMNDDYIVLGDFDEDDYTWLDPYTMDERV